MSIQTIKEKVIQLEKADQIDLMHFMIELLTSKDFKLSDDWKSEIEERIKSLENGTSVGRSARDVIAKYTAQ